MDNQRPEPGQIEERSSEALEVDGRRIRGIVPYGVESRDMGGWREIIEPSAFRTTSFDELRAVVDHRGVPLATYPRTLELEDRSDGLHWSLDPPKSRADVIEAIERGDMRAGSWRMKVAKDRWEGDTRHVEAISDLYDVTITGAELPAYPAAAVEYRSTPTEAAEERQEATMPEHEERSSDEERTTNDDTNTSGGLHVEDRTEQVKRNPHLLRELVGAEFEDRARITFPSKDDLIDELAVACRELRVGELRSLTASSSSLSNPAYSAQLFDLLRPQSVFLASGVAVITTSSSSLIYPQLTADSTIGWVSEAGTIAASDPTIVQGTATPHKLAVRVEYSNEAAEDSVPALETVLRQSLAARAALQLDIAAFEGTGTAPQPLGMGNVAGVGAVNAAASASSYAWAGSAVAYLEGQNVPRPYTYVGGSALVRNLRSVVVGTAVPLVSPVTGGVDGALPTIYGARGYMANGLAGGTVYFYSPSCCYVVNRTGQLEIEINRARLFDSDRSEIRLKTRLDYVFPYPKAICRGTAIS